MPDVDDTVPPPLLPQSTNGTIDESKLDQSVLVILVRRYETAHVGDYIIVNINDYISSKPYYITYNTLDYPEYEITVPFYTIPLGEYSVSYTITDWAGNPTTSPTTSVVLKKSDTPPPPPPPSGEVSTLDVRVLSNGMPANGYTPIVLQVTALDNGGKPVANAPLSINATHDLNIIPASEFTDQNGQSAISVTSDNSGIFSISIFSGKINCKEDIYFAEATQGKLNINGTQPVGEYEILSIQSRDAITNDLIINSSVYLYVESKNGLNYAQIINNNTETLRPMITDDYGQFKINLKGPVGSSCTIHTTVGNRQGKVEYTRESEG